MQTQDNTEMYFRKGNQSTQWKTSTLQAEIDPLVNKVGIHE